MGFEAELHLLPSGRQVAAGSLQQANAHLCELGAASSACCAGQAVGDRLV